MLIARQINFRQWKKKQNIVHQNAELITHFNALEANIKDGYCGAYAQGLYAMANCEGLLQG